MKTIGIIGGLGPEATIDYYKEIIKRFNAINSHGSLNYPQIVIYSVTMSKFIGLLEEKNYVEATNYLVESITNLKNAGADFGVLSANTPHLLFNDIKARVDLPLISIVETCAQKASAMGLKRCALLGTKFTMKNDFYAKEFHLFNIEIVVPNDSQIETIHTKLFNELELGIFKDETREELLQIVTDIKSRVHIDGVILGCTEFPILFTQAEYLDLPFLNTTTIHAEAIVKECLKV